MIRQTLIDLLFDVQLENISVTEAADLIDGDKALHDADVIADFIHYPDCWDTMAYPDLGSAIEEFSHCNTCDQPFGCNSVKEGE